MEATDQIRNQLIEKLLLIKDKEVLSAMDKILEANVEKEMVYKVTAKQRQTLEASEEDIKYGRIISHEDLNQEEDEWLKE